MLQELAAGRNNAAIAKTLFMSERAVEKHIGSVFQKLGLVARGRRQPPGDGGARVPRGDRRGALRGERAGEPPPKPGASTMSRHARKGHDVGVEEDRTAIRVLVVDDQVAYRRALAAVVAETEGFEMVVETASGEESLVVAAEVRPDLVLMDVNLPGITGIDAARTLTGAPGGPVVVLLSTYDEDEFELEGCGAAAYVAKAAFGPDRLSEVWAAAVR